MNCPCCFSEDNTDVLTHRFSLMFESANSYVFPASFHFCNECSHIWYNIEQTTISADILGQYYKKKKYAESKMVVGDRQYRSLQKIAKMIDVHGLWGHYSSRILEIGGGDGTFANVFLNTFADRKMEFSIYDFASVQPIDKRVRKVDSLEEYRKNLADFVIARHTLEHVPDPFAFIKQIATTLAPDGFLYLEVPCWTVPHHVVDELNVEHLQYFTHQSLDALLLRTGGFSFVSDFSFSIEEYFTPSRILGKMYRKSDITAEICLTERLDQGTSFRTKVENSRKQLAGLAEYIRSKSGSGISVGMHGATITFEDFMINEGCDLSSLGELQLFDNAESKVNREICGFRVHTPDSASASNLGIVISFSSYTDIIEKSWRDKGFTGEFMYYLNVK